VPLAPDDRAARRIKVNHAYPFVRTATGATGEKIVMLRDPWLDNDGDANVDDDDDDEDDDDEDAPPPPPPDDDDDDDDDDNVPPPPQQDASVASRSSAALSMARMSRRRLDAAILDAHRECR
jgi:hypothetical protein